jgi:VCBS repeat protein
MAHRWSVLVLVLLACSRHPEPPSRPGAPPQIIPVGVLPVDLAAGDLDGNGTLDLISADAHDRTISVRLQRDGAWVAGDPVATGFEPHLVALADLDGDHDLDLVATSHDSGAVFVAHNDGTGRFTPAPGSPVTAFAVTRPHNHGLAVGDLNGDGRADVVVADQIQQAIAVLLADERGSLALQGPPIALGAEVYPPALGDLDGDGRLDLVVPLLGSDAIGVLLGDGSGRFAHAPGSPYHTGRARPYAIALGDLDNDGTLDVFAPHDDTSDISVLLNTGHGALRPAPGSPVSAGLRLWRAAMADLDGDGALDVVGVGSGMLIAFHGDGHGGLTVWWGTAAEGWTAIAPDLDGDGRPDPVTADQAANALLIWPSRDSTRSRGGGEDGR